VSKVLVTGGFGFVGSRLVKRLLDQGNEVVVLEHQSAAAPKELNKIEVLRADIADENSMANVKRAGLDAVLHLAAQSSGPRSFSIPVQDVKLNVLGTINTIDWCVANSVERIIFASSFVIYGDHPDREYMDESTPCRPKSIYATSKLACEHMLMNYAQPKGVKWNALRMFNVYGPGQNITKPDQGLVGIFMNMLRQKDDVQVKGSLQRFRDLIYVDDVIQGWEKCLAGSAYNESFNLGTGQKTTFEMVIKDIAATLGKSDKLRIEELPGTPGDMMGSVADITKIKAKLGYEPKVPLREGLKRMWEWVEANPPK
jgi:UDP-glucose 4-epimerase